MINSTEKLTCAICGKRYGDWDNPDSPDEAFSTVKDMRDLKIEVDDKPYDWEQNCCEKCEEIYEKINRTFGLERVERSYESANIAFGKKDDDGKWLYQYRMWVLGKNEFIELGRFGSYGTGLVTQRIDGRSGSESVYEMDVNNPSEWGFISRMIEDGVHGVLEDGAEMISLNERQLASK